MFLACSKYEADPALPGTFLPDQMRFVCPEGQKIEKFGIFRGH